MAITRELQRIEIIVGPSGPLDHLNATWRVFDDVENTEGMKTKVINVGQQVQDAIAPLVAVVLEKVTTDVRVVTRPVAA